MSAKHLCIGQQMLGLGLFCLGKRNTMKDFNRTGFRITMVNLATKFCKQVIERLFLFTQTVNDL